MRKLHIMNINVFTESSKRTTKIRTKTRYKLQNRKSKNSWTYVGKTTPRSDTDL